MLFKFISITAPERTEGCQNNPEAALPMLRINQLEGLGPNFVQQMRKPWFIFDTSLMRFGWS